VISVRKDDLAVERQLEAPIPLSVGLMTKMDDPYGEPGLNYLCPSYKAFFHHVDASMRAMSELLTAGRAPSELVHVYGAEDAKRGRNEPCTCGSGRKWKRCHGAEPALAG
jgi:hypothetical protein